MNSTLREVQLVQVEILKTIDYLCEKNQIKYSLHGGSLIGAVRHKGFIPWDDDLDICMSRSDYERFIAVWEKESPTGFILQNKENTPEFTQSFTKIRKDHTSFIQFDWEKGLYHTGIFVDVFPIDRVPSNRIAKYCFYWNYLKYQLYTRGHIPSDASLLIKAVSGFLLRITPKQMIPHKRENLLKKVTKYNVDDSLDTVSAEVLWTMRINLPNNLTKEYTKLMFEGQEFMCFSQWDEYLRRTYGDYMKLPPVEERTWTHHPIIIDFEHNYEELNG